MKCKKIEEILIEANIKDLDPSTQQHIKNHLDSCSRCREFAEKLEYLRKTVSSSFPLPPEELLQRTRKACLQALTREEEDTQPQRSKEKNSLPLFIKLMLPTLTVLTVVMWLLLSQDFSLSLPLNIQATTFLALTLQNLTMLILAPLLLRRPQGMDKLRRK